MSRWEFFPLQLEGEFEWLKAKAECSLTDDMNGIVAYRDDNLVAAIGLDSWSYNSVTIHIAVTDPLVFKHGFAEECYEYIFNTCDKGVLIGITPSNNLKALAFNRHIGLVEIYRIRDGYDVGIDYVVQEARKENCKYLRVRDGQENRSRAA